MNVSDMTKHVKSGRAGQPKLQELPPGTPIQVDLKNATKQQCECGNDTFIPAIQVYKVSALISPTGQELIANQQVVICTKCFSLYGGPK